MNCPNLERELERRLRERALRADGGVKLDEATIERWLHEELLAIVEESGRARARERLRQS